MALGSVDLNASSASVLLRPGCTLESPGCPDQLDEHFHKGGDLGSGIFQSFPDASNVQPGGTQCLPEAKERTAAESSCDQMSCHSGYVGARCEHADLLAVVAASQKKQAITALVVVSVVALAVLIIACVLIHCCQVRKHCEWCRALICRHEKPSALLKGRTACCHSETVV
uniref:Transforming growth factor alpha n=1 Tax=Equus caballus TaxID=9796 RepID=A0A9L0R3R5_HORSE